MQILSEIKLGEQKWINILPSGEFFDRRYGKVTIDKALTDQMVKNFKNGIPSYKPSVDLDHQGGPAYGWVEDMRSDDKGLWALVNFVADGEKLIKDGRYRYVSAEWNPNYMNKETGKDVGPTLLSFALTNRPAHPGIREVKLMDSLKGKIVSFMDSMKDFFDLSTPDVVDMPSNDHDPWSFTTNEADALWKEGQKEYSKAFAWYDSLPELDKDGDGYPDQKYAYKLPHHKLENGQLTLYRSGVIAAMAALLGAHGGVDIPASERKQVYNHLAAHYKHFGIEPPKYHFTEVNENMEMVELKEEIRKLSEENKKLAEVIDGLVKEKEQAESRLFVEKKNTWVKDWTSKGIAPAMIEKVGKLILSEKDFAKYDAILKEVPKIDLSQHGSEEGKAPDPIEYADNVSRAAYGGED